MDNYAILKNSGEYTIFQFNDEIIRFVTSSRLERYTKVVEWDKGYLVVMAKYEGINEVEEYIDLKAENIVTAKEIESNGYLRENEMSDNDARE